MTLKLHDKLIKTNDNIREAVKLWLTNPSAAEILFGHISLWDTSAVTDMSELFMFAEFFNDDISKWCTTSVVSMKTMFLGAKAFNCNIGGWDVAAVTTMAFMFFNASSFDSDISMWETKNVTTMWCQFQGATKFTQDISEWDTTAVTDTVSAFVDCPVNFIGVWGQRRLQPVWNERWTLQWISTEKKRTEDKIQRSRDRKWYRRRDWMIAIASFLRGDDLTSSPLQIAFDIRGLLRYITSFV